jgi:hypothetical protein
MTGRNGHHGDVRYHDGQPNCSAAPDPRERVARLQRLTLYARPTLLALLQEAIPPATRWGAARTILEMGLKVREVAELEQRLAALEARLPQAS